LGVVDPCTKRAGLGAWLEIIRARAGALPAPNLLAHRPALCQKRMHHVMPRTRESACRATWRPTRLRRGGSAG